jgi:hypothetical protein
LQGVANSVKAETHTPTPEGLNDRSIPDIFDDYATYTSKRPRLTGFPMDSHSQLGRYDSFQSSIPSVRMLDQEDIISHSVPMDEYLMPWGHGIDLFHPNPHCATTSKIGNHLMEPSSDLEERKPEGTHSLTPGWMDTKISSKEMLQITGTLVKNPSTEQSEETNVENPWNSLKMKQKNRSISENCH